jgi:predicted transcriptional regulator
LRVVQGVVQAAALSIQGASLIQLTLGDNGDLYASGQAQGQAQAGATATDYEDIMAVCRGHDSIMS